MNEYVEKAKKTFSSFGRKAIRKSTEVYEITKTSVKISSIKEAINEEYKKIGEIVYKNYRGQDVPSGELEEICGKIEELNSQIEDLSVNLANLKNLTSCPVCGAEITKDSTFCAKCGEKID